MQPNTQPQRQQPPQQQPMPIATPAERRAGRLVGMIVGLGFIVMSLIPIGIGSVFTISSLQQNNMTAHANATVTTLTPSTMRLNQGGTPTAGQAGVGQTTTVCSLGYQFKVANKKYTGTTDVSSDSNCGHTQGSQIAISYNPKNPTSNAFTSGSASAITFGIVIAVIGLAMLALGLGIVIYTRRNAKQDIANGGDPTNGGAPATSAQLELIQNGFQDLGQFYTPRRMTQAEAREMITDIQRQLAITRGQNPGSN